MKNPYIILAAIIAAAILVAVWMLKSLVVQPPCRVRVILEKPTFSVLPLDRLEAGLCSIMGHWLRHMASQNSGVPEEDRISLSFRKARSLAIPCCVTQLRGQSPA